MFIDITIKVISFYIEYQYFRMYERIAIRIYNGPLSCFGMETCQLKKKNSRKQSK